jgi:hypothetical protein
MQCVKRVVKCALFRRISLTHEKLPLPGKDQSLCFLDPGSDLFAVCFKKSRHVCDMPSLRSEVIMLGLRWRLCWSCT